MKTSHLIADIDNFLEDPTSTETAIDLITVTRAQLLKNKEIRQSIIKAIDKFDRETKREMHTDTGDAWNLFRGIKHDLSE